MGESLLNKTNVFPISIANGGTGATTASGARTNLGVYKPTVLYDNASGSSNTITLSDSATNYTYLDIHACDISYDGRVLTRVHDPNGKAPSLIIMVQTETAIYWKSALITINGTSITWNYNYQAEATIPNGTVNSDSGNPIIIFRVEGYSY